MLARNAQRLGELSQTLPGSRPYPCDVSDPSQVEATADAIERDLGAPSVLIHNAVGGAFGSFLDIDPQVLNRNFQVNTMGLLYLARRFAPAMVKASKGAIMVTGNTSSLRGRAGFAGFAPTKAAQRILAEAIARDLGPQGHPRCLPGDRCRHRRPLDARALQGQAKRVLHPTRCNR